MKALFIKDKNRRYSYFLIEKKKYILKYIFNNLSLSTTIRNFAYAEYINLVQYNSHTKIRNRCVLTNRGRAVYRNFKLSRLFFKQYALQGDLMGVKKAS
jgi:small subunit ribosomal protein S14